MQPYGATLSQLVAFRRGQFWPFCSYLLWPIKASVGGPTATAKQEGLVTQRLWAELVKAFSPYLGIRWSQKASQGCHAEVFPVHALVHGSFKHWVQGDQMIYHTTSGAAQPAQHLHWLH